VGKFERERFRKCRSETRPLQRIELERFYGDVAGSSSIVVYLLFISGKQNSLPFFFRHQTLFKRRWTKPLRGGVERPVSSMRLR
jgi:hypothetical protein